MRAIVIGDDRRLRAVALDRPAPGPGEVLVEVKYCGICGSDLHLPELPAEMIPAGHVLGQRAGRAAVATPTCATTASTPVPASGARVATPRP